MSKWISVKEKYPPKHIDVLAYLGDNMDYYILCWNGRRWVNRWCEFSSAVTYWKRLPEKPEKIDEIHSA